MVVLDGSQAYMMTLVLFKALADLTIKDRDWHPGFEACCSAVGETSDTIDACVRVLKIASTWAICIYRLYSLTSGIVINRTTLKADVSFTACCVLFSYTCSNKLHPTQLNPAASILSPPLQPSTGNCYPIQPISRLCTLLSCFNTPCLHCIVLLKKNMTEWQVLGLVTLLQHPRLLTLALFCHKRLL